MSPCIVGNEVNLIDLANKYGTPLLVYDLKKVEENYRAIKEALGAKIFYSVKANANLALLSFLKKLGSNIDAVSPGEIYLAMKAGIEPSNILYTASYLSDEDIKYGINAGVIFNFDSKRSFKRAISLGYKHKPIFFRLDLGYDKGFTAGVTLAGEENKFGMFLRDAIEAYGFAKSLGAEEFGIHA
ncbi:MAG: diaminopimelate decarboxylase, partial [Thermocladium sp.]